MKRTITVTGIGRLRRCPDLAVFSITTKAKSTKYEKALQLAAEQLESLRAAAAQAGFDPEELKTAAFRTEEEYRTRQEKDGSCRRIRGGYDCIQEFRLSLPLKPERLSAAAAALSRSDASPRFDVRFTVQNPSAVREELLALASGDARRTAGLLLEANGVKLGRLCNIEVGEESPMLFSDLTLQGRELAPAAAWKPDEIEANVSVRFTWEIED